MRMTAGEKRVESLKTAGGPASVPLTAMQEALGYVANEVLLQADDDVKALWVSPARHGLLVLAESMVNGWGDLRFSMSDLSARALPEISHLQGWQLWRALQGANIIQSCGSGFLELTPRAKTAVERVHQAAARELA